MSVYIEYIKKLSSQNNNIVIFVSSISQLKNIDFLTNIEFNSQDKALIKSLNAKNHAVFYNINTKHNTLSNIAIYLIGPKNNDYLEIGGSIYNNFKNIEHDNITFLFDKYIISNFKKNIADIVLGYKIRSYNFDKYKTQKISMNIVTLNIYNMREFKELSNNLNLLKAINFTKDLVSEPANILNPISYANKCNELKIKGLKVKILDQTQLKKIGMNSLMAVAQGSVNEPRVVIFEWNLKDNIKPTILVGKGVTFDSGGISLKSSGGMEEMIIDMGGSAVVVGSMINVALNNINKSIVGIIGLVENMPDGNAQRPGDIISSHSGQTIEVMNTDAEGRMVLADILSYAQENYKPKQIIDFATLTGAIMIALGTHRAGLFANNDILSKKIEKAGDITGEKVWRLPLGNEYDNEINSTRADMKNIGSSRYGGSIHAAQFIQRFINNKTPWAHIDIAGVSWTMKAGQNSFTKLHNPGATAFGVRLINQFLKGK